MEVHQFYKVVPCPCRECLSSNEALVLDAEKVKNLKRVSNRDVPSPLASYPRHGDIDNLSSCDETLTSLA